MRLALLISLVLALAAAPVRAHGGEPPPPPEPPEEPGLPPVPPPPPPLLPPMPPAPPHEGGPPGNPTAGPEPEMPGAPEQPRPDVPRDTSDLRARRKGGATSGSSAWRLWWNYNREDLIGMRGRMRDAVTTSGIAETYKTPLAERRDAVRDALRQAALRDRKVDVRAAAIVALGRMGDDDDARSFVRILHGAGEKTTLKEAAAVALAILPPIRDPVIKKEVRDYLAHVIQYDQTLPGRVRGLCLLASGLRAGREPMLMLRLTGRADGQGFDSDEAGTLAYALGLSAHPMAAPELARAAKRRKLGKEKLTDVGRAQATQGLAFIGDATACRSLISLLGSRRAGEQTRRSAALGLGRILTTQRLDQPMTEQITEALEKAIAKDRDLLVKGFASVALGTVRRAAARESLERSLDDGGRTELKPFLALGLGIWAHRAGAASRKPAQKTLVDELQAAKEPELASALCIACGLAEAAESREPMRRLLTTSGNALLRGAAAEGLGLLGEPAPPVVSALEAVLAEGDKSGVLADAALALGLLGRRAAAGELARGLRETNSSVVQGRIIIALAHLGHREAIDPLLAILQDQQEQTLVREFAAVALGMMGDERDRDPLFALDAWFNYYATTRATNELLRLY